MFPQTAKHYMQSLRDKWLETLPKTKEEEEEEELGGTLHSIFRTEQDQFRSHSIVRNFKISPGDRAENCRAKVPK